MADSVESTVRWRMPILGWVAIGLAILALVFIAWLTSSGDLVRLDARAKGLGIAASWEEVGLRVSPASRIATWRQLGQLAGAVKSYQDAASWRFRPDQPLPSELGAHHASLGAAVQADLRELCDGLPPEGLVLRNRFNYDTPYPELTWLREYCRYASERILLAPSEQVVTESARMLAVITVRRSQLALVERLVSVSCLAMWVQAVGWRLEHAPVDREALAGQAEAVRHWLAEDMPGVLDGEFCAWRTVAGDAHRGAGKATTDLDVAFGLPRGIGAGRTFMRAARGDALDLLLDMAHDWHAAAGYLERSAAMKAAQSRLMAMSEWSPAQRLSSLIMPSGSLINDLWMKIDTALLVLAAELRGQPWPADPTDPTGLTIRRIERGGRLIGCYLLGSDRADGGGRIRGDLCVPLYDRLGSVMAADPPKDP